MNQTDHLAMAIYHLTEVANHDHSHLLYERDTRWTERVLASAASRAALQLLTDQTTTVHIRNAEAWCDGIPAK
jgi:hypothetical protein